MKAFQSELLFPGIFPLHTVDVAVTYFQYFELCILLSTHFLIMDRKPYKQLFAIFDFADFFGKIRQTFANFCFMLFLSLFV